MLPILAILIDMQMSLAETNSQIHLALANDETLAERVSQARVGDTDAFTPTDELRVRNWLLAMLEPRISIYHLRDSDFVLPEDRCGTMRGFDVSYNRPWFRTQIDDDVPYADAMQREYLSRCVNGIPKAGESG